MSSGYKLSRLRHPEGRPEQAAFFVVREQGKLNGYKTKRIVQGRREMDALADPDPPVDRSSRSSYAN